MKAKHTFFTTVLFVVSFVVHIGMSPLRLHAQVGPGGQQPDPDYYPLKVGTTWRYHLSPKVDELNELYQGDVLVTVSRVENFFRTPLAVLEEGVDGRVTTIEYLNADPLLGIPNSQLGILSRYRVGSRWYELPMLLLKYPADKAAPWEQDWAVGDVHGWTNLPRAGQHRTSVRGQVLGSEGVTVPAGKYETVKASFRVTNSVGVEQSEVVWFAPHVGMVKRTVNSSRKNVLDRTTFNIELTNFEQGDGRAVQGDTKDKLVGKAPAKVITNSVGMKLTLIPAGEFIMGFQDDDGQMEEFPKHVVWITRPFYLGVTEVTRGQFRRFVEDEVGYRTEAERDGKGGRGWNEAAGKSSKTRSTLGRTLVSSRPTSIRW